MRSYPALLATVLAAGMLVPALAQRPQPSRPPAADDDEEVVRITTNLVQVGSELAPGDYVLQVVVTDEVARGPKRDGRGTAAQWVDFEVVDGKR